MAGPRRPTSARRRAQQNASDQAKKTETEDTGVGIARPRVQAAPIKISSELLAQAKRKPRPRDEKVSPLAVDYQPFGIPEHPPGVGPRKETPHAKAGMAADDTLTPVISWANQNVLASAWLEGQVFLGYAELAILAQRPEYRVVSEEIASEMTREWIEFESSSGKEDQPVEEGGKPDKTAEKIKELEAEMEALDVKGAFNHAAEYDGFMGRSHLYIDTGDTENEEELQTSIGDGSNLVSKTKIKRKKIKAIRPVEAVWAYPTDYESSDPLKKDWYKPEMWYVMGKRVHHTRLLTFIGREVPDMLKPAYSFGGLSMTQMIKPYVDNWLRTRQSVSDMIKSYSVSGLKTNLGTATMPGGGQDLFTRVDFMNAMRDNRGALVLDKESEEWFQIATPLSTLDALQAQSQEHMASVSRIPIVKLLGIQPAGLNASSEGEIKSFYDWIAAYQEKLFKRHLTTVIHFVMLSLWGRIDKNITWNFRPLAQLTEEQEMELEMKKTDIDDKNVTMGAIGPEEVRKRVTQDKKSQYHGLELDPEAVPEPAMEEGMMNAEGGIQPPPNEMAELDGELTPEEIAISEGGMQSLPPLSQAA